MPDQPKSPPQVSEWALAAAEELNLHYDMSWGMVDSDPLVQKEFQFAAAIITRHFTLAQPRSEEVRDSERLEALMNFINDKGYHNCNWEITFGLRGICRPDIDSMIIEAKEAGFPLVKPALLHGPAQERTDAG